MNHFNGILPVYKPKGFTSHDVVAKIRKLTSMRRVGHTGTLDPDVEGVLPICLGRATRVVEYIQDLPKRYKGSFVLGVGTDTQDLSGTVIEEVDITSISSNKVEEACRQFVGPIMQVPPMYSAVKVNGKKCYELARKGEVVERSPRQVHIYDLTCLSVSEEERRPRVDFDVRCSKGTYIRTLCVDIGKYLGYPACMSDLERIESGIFHRDDCFSFDDIEDMIHANSLQAKLTKIDEVLGQFPRMILHEEDQVHIQNGCYITVDNPMKYDGLFCIYTYSGFQAIYEWNQKEGVGKPKKVF